MYEAKNEAGTLRCPALPVIFLAASCLNWGKDVIAYIHSGLQTLALGRKT